MLAIAATPVVAFFVVGAGAIAVAKPAAHHHARHHKKARKPAAKKKTRAQVRAELRKQLLKHPTLALDSSFMQRLQTAGAIVPFTVRFQRPYEGGVGDDVLQLQWDTASEDWPLAGTKPPATASTTNLTGAFTYEWDFSADTSGYATLGTVETIVGGGVSLTGTGFPIAAEDPSVPCASKTLKQLDATGVAFTSAGVRFGIVNPFSGDVQGTINLRSQVRSQATPCDPAAPVPPSQLATTDGADPPLPVAFNGKFLVSPGVTSDGYLRLGVLRIDAAKMPQRSVYGYVWACTVADPSTPSDTCNRKKFPVRTSWQSLNAEVLVGDHMPPAPPAP